MMELGNLGGAYRNQLFQDIDYNATIQFVNRVLSDMEEHLTSRQLTELHNILQTTITKYSISSDKNLYDDMPYNELNKQLLTRFMEDKRLQGLSEKSLEYYRTSVIRLIQYHEKGLDSITTDDIRNYFEYLLEDRRCSKSTIDNNRRIFNSFYNHCVVNGLLFKNPLKKIDTVKGIKKVKKPFTNKEIILMRENFTNLRDEAIFELLLSSGMRIGELVKLNKNDLNMNDCSVIVTGKGNKQREVFFNDLAKHKIESYLKTRMDDNPALFVSTHKPYNRFKISGIERQIRLIGKKAGVHDVHPHKFRRTFATRLLHKGVPMDQIQKLLGHAQIETTQLYASSATDEVEYNIKRYIN